MKNYFLKTVMFFTVLIAIFPYNGVKASTLNDVLTKIEQLQNQVAELQIQLQGAVLDSAVTTGQVTISEDFIFPRFIILNIGVSSQNQEVKKLQSFLAKYGYFSGNIDGIFGRKTEEGVRNFQTANQLTVDGKVGLVTSSSINKKISDLFFDETNKDIIEVGKKPMAYTCVGQNSIQYNVSLSFEEQITPDKFLISEDGYKNICFLSKNLKDGIITNSSEIFLPDGDLSSLIHHYSCWSKKGFKIVSVQYSGGSYVTEYTVGKWHCVLTSTEGSK